MTLQTPCRLIAALSLVILATACSDGTTAPQPTTAVPATSTTAARPTIAPLITRTLNLTPVWGRPCEPINQAFLSDIGLSSPTSVNPAGNRQLCVWEKDQPSGPRLAIAIEGDDPLGGAYRGSNGPLRAYFRPTTVAGLPAVFYSVNSTAQGVCGVVVGTGPDQGITAIAGGSDSVDWCVKAEVAAMQVVQFLGG
jgi:hypothetical protein